MPKEEAAMYKPYQAARSSSRSSQDSHMKKPKPKKPTTPRPTPPPPASSAKKPSHRRTPLSDLNAASASGEAAKKAGCFRFLTSRPAPRTPVSAPPNSGRPTNASSRRSDTRLTNPAKPKTPDLLQRLKPKKPSSGNPKWALTPEKTGKEEEGKVIVIKTPASGATPPIQASISPEVPCGPALSATPACFAAGHHLVAGVHDRRKCRPRGILTIAGEGETVPENDDPARASIHWLSSPSEVAGTGSGYMSECCSTKYGNEASVKYCSPIVRIGRWMLGKIRFFCRPSACSVRGGVLNLG